MYFRSYHMYIYKTFIYSFLFYSIYQSTLIRESTLSRKFDYLVNVKLIMDCRSHISKLFSKYFFRMIYNFKIARYIVLYRNFDKFPLTLFLYFEKLK